MPRLRRAVAAPDEPRRPVSLRELPAPLRAALRVPELRRALHDRADVVDRDGDLQLVRRLDAAADMTVAPSILSADFAGLGEQVGRVLDAEAKVTHVDVMDGPFVPPITMGPIVVEALREQVHGAGAILEVHLMVERPERQVQAFAEAGADRILAQVEATPNPAYAVDAIRRREGEAGGVINPGPPVEAGARGPPDIH